MPGFIDFDGVICDSLRECFASAHLSAFGTLPGEGDFDSALYAGFRAQRPYVSLSEDYSVILDLFASGAFPEDRAEFAARKAGLGEERIAELRQAFLEARRLFLETERELWFAYNPLYPFLREALGGILGEKGAWILSTKPAEFIHEILARNGIAFDPRRIASVHREGKLEAILRIAGPEASFLVDDQIEHLLPCIGSSVKPYLATWGYCEGPSNEVDNLDPKGFLALFP